MSVRTSYRRVDLSRLTGSTAPPRVLLSFIQRNGLYVEVGRGGQLLLGPLKIAYWIERSDFDGIYLRRWDTDSW